MKQFFFDFIGRVGQIFLVTTAFLSQASLKLVNGIWGAVWASQVFVIKTLLRLAHREQFELSEAGTTQHQILSELRYLGLILKVKNDALEAKMWTDNHSLALSEAANSLLVECDWTPERVHAYVRGVVESIGLIYATGDDYEEDEDDGIPLS
jgi:hypothetical protein